jgi:hypothetical protein
MKRSKMTDVTLLHKIVEKEKNVSKMIKREEK